MTEYCPACELTNTEPHPRVPEIRRCVTCKEWLVIPRLKQVYVINQGVVDQVIQEMKRQVRLWGEQNHPDGSFHWSVGDRFPAATEAQAWCAENVDNNTLTWADILTEELAEVEDAETLDDRYHELVQVAAVALSWAESIKRRNSG